MSEELGKIEKPAAEAFEKGRKLYFIPLIYCSDESPEEYLEKYNRYWEQVTKQIEELELKLGKVTRIYHELVPVAGEDGCKIIRELNEKSHQVIKACLDESAQVEAMEDAELLTEFLDWNRCLIMGLQNQQVFTKVSEFYFEAVKKRNEHIAGKINETLKEEETGLLLMRENHQIQFPADIQVFYVAPPALDEIKRWLRERESSQDQK